MINSNEKSLQVIEKKGIFIKIINFFKRILDKNKASYILPNNDIGNGQNNKNSFFELIKFGEDPDTVKLLKIQDELEKRGINAQNVFELTKDLSAYMQPEPWDIKIQPNSIGINVSGLAYSNRFRTLSGQFESYPKLIDCLISHFLNKGHTVYLIPHSFDYKHPEKNNDDMVACRTAYQKLSPPKKNVIVVDKDMTAPQIKYVISQMNFFIGTRMHANFAAIYTNVPLFGLAYSYKFEGAFDANGLNGKEQTAIINNITPKDIDTIIEKIEKVYKKTL